MLRQEGQKVIEQMVTERTKYLEEAQRMVGQHLGDYKGFVSEFKGEMAGKAEELLAKGAKTESKALQTTEQNVVKEVEHAGGAMNKIGAAAGAVLAAHGGYNLIAGDENERQGGKLAVNAAETGLGVLLLVKNFAKAFGAGANKLVNIASHARG